MEQNSTSILSAHGKKSDVETVPFEELHFHQAKLQSLPMFNFNINFIGVLIPLYLFQLLSAIIPRSI